MSPGEIAWRLRSKIIDVLDKYRFKIGWYPSAQCIHEGDIGEFAFNFGAGDPGAGLWEAQLNLMDWRERLTARVDKIAEHRLSFFNLTDHFIGDPIDWNRDHDSGKKAPLSYSQSIDYRDFRAAGDCKLVWEPNRHHQLVVLGRAYRASGDIRYAAEVVTQLQSWMGQCPFAKGMNWRSPLELGIRLINWVWAIELIRESGLVVGEFRSRLLHNAYLHLWEVSRKFSRGSSANNHLVGEAAGVFIASSYFSNLKNVATWRDESQKILIDEILEQTYPDGGTREQAMGYHLFVLQFFLFAGIVGRWIGREFPADYWQRIEKMLEFAGAMIEGGDNLPMFGDGDEGYVLDLGAGPCSVKDLLCIGAILFNRADFKTLSRGFCEPALWLMGQDGFEKYEVISDKHRNYALTSKGFADCGYFLMQSGTADGKNRISVLVDCGELGFKSIAAHGHADALSIVLRAFGKDIFIDPGTYDYFTYPEWRNYFRSTRAHNTVVVDGLDQSVMIGAFMWGKRAHARCLSWDTAAGGGGKLVAEHDGYRRLSDPVTHRRTVEMDPNSRVVIILDEIFAAERHTVSIFFHLSEHCSASKSAANLIAITLPEGRLELEMDPRLTLEILRGSEKPMGGWVSRGYHRKEPSMTIIATCECYGNGSFKSVIRIAGRTGD